MPDKKISVKAEFVCICGWSGVFSQLSSIKRSNQSSSQFENDFLCPSPGCNATLAYGSTESGLFAYEGVIVWENQRDD